MSEQEQRGFLDRIRRPELRKELTAALAEGDYAKFTFIVMSVFVPATAAIAGAGSLFVNKATEFSGYLYGKYQQIEQFQARPDLVQVITYKSLEPQRFEYDVGEDIGGGKMIRMEVNSSANIVIPASIYNLIKRGEEDMGKYAYAYSKTIPRTTNGLIETGQKLFSYFEVGRFSPITEVTTDNFAEQISILRASLLSPENEKVDVVQFKRGSKDSGIDVKSWSWANASGVVAASTNSGIGK